VKLRQHEGEKVIVSDSRGGPESDVLAVLREDFDEITEAIVKKVANGVRISQIVIKSLMRRKL